MHNGQTCPCFSAICWNCCPGWMWGHNPHIPFYCLPLLPSPAFWKWHPPICPMQHPCPGTHAAIIIIYNLIFSWGLLKHRQVAHTADGNTLVLSSLIFATELPKCLHANERNGATAAWSSCKKGIFKMQARYPSHPCWAVFLTGKGGHTGCLVWGWLSTRDAS